jgi:hypothetical protein
VVDETWPKFKKLGKKMFTIEELCKLRRAEIEREQEAFFWFFGEFLESVCGARQWPGEAEGASADLESNIDWYYP